MKIIELSLNDFDALYYTLTEYLTCQVSSDDCIAKGLKYINEIKLLLKPVEESLIGTGYMFIHRYSYSNDGFRSIYFSPDTNKLFYEGWMPIRYLDEMRYVDYKHFDADDIKVICKKYNLKPIKSPAINTSDVICPLCKSSNTEKKEIRENNGVIGQGFASYVTDSWYNCKDCGIRFNKVK